MSWSPRHLRCIMSANSKSDTNIKSSLKGRQLCFPYLLFLLGLPQASKATLTSPLLPSFCSSHAFPHSFPSVLLLSHLIGSSRKALQFSVGRLDEILWFFFVLVFTLMTTFYFIGFSSLLLTLELWHKIFSQMHCGWNFVFISFSCVNLIISMRLASF